MEQPRGGVLAPTIAVFLAAATAEAAASFPLRSEYPTAKPISTAELASQLDGYLVVDVRSKLEFDVIHINGAVHIPVADESFVSRAKAITARESGKTAVFYCNGISCAKSYKAAVAMMEAGVSNVRV
jgi:rhodanese-related sulfurtransferase